MIDHFVELIDDETDIEQVGWVAYSSDPDPTGSVTRGEVSSEVAKAMQFAVYAQSDAEEEVEQLRVTIKEQGEQIEKMESSLDYALTTLTRLTRELVTRGIILDGF